MEFKLQGSLGSQVPSQILLLTVYISFIFYVKPSSEPESTKTYGGNTSPSRIVSKTRGEEKCPGFCFLSTFQFPAGISPGQTQTETNWCENMVVRISV